MLPWAPVPISQRQPAQVHLSEGQDQWLGDSRKAPKKAGPDGKTDTNVQALLDGAGCIHKEKPVGTGWVWLAQGKGRPRRPLTPEELRTPYSQWPKAKFVLLRRTKWAGISFESRVRPLLFVESVAVHKKYGAIMCAELKSPFTKRAATAMVNAANRQRQTVWFKTLAHQGLKAPQPGYSMAVAGEKLRTFHAAGGQTALAAHGFPKPSDLDEWADFYDAIWGHWA